MGDGHNNNINTNTAGLRHTNNASDNSKSQIVKSHNKRRLEDSPKRDNNQRIAFNDGRSTSKNMFALLRNNNVEENEDMQKLTDLPDITGMLTEISKVIMPQEYSYKSLKDGQIRLMTKSTNTYRTVVKHLNARK